MIHVLTGNQAIFKSGEYELRLEPLKALVDPSASSFRVGKVKVEIILVKKAGARWGNLVSEGEEG